MKQPSPDGGEKNGPLEGAVEWVVKVPAAHPRDRPRAVARFIRWMMSDDALAFGEEMINSPQGSRAWLVVREARGRC